MSNRREFLLLAKPSKENDENIGGYYLSEKLDGMRCLWDGGVSRGIPVNQVPWGNDAKNGDRLATGLWSRYANPIYAPDWFLNTLPSCVMDGELYGGRGRFQKTMSACKKLVPVDSEWKTISYRVFSTPTLKQLFRDGECRDKNFTKTIVYNDCIKFFSEHSRGEVYHLVADKPIPFCRELEYLERWLEEADPTVVSLHCQLKLPEDTDHAWEIANRKTTNIVDDGGEGCVLRSNEAYWVPKRIGEVLKIKPWFDDEGIVIGVTSGRVGKQGNRHGLVGNFVVRYKDVEFELSGFNNSELAINCPIAQKWAIDNPDSRFPEEYLEEGVFQFDMGQEITFKYREFTDAGKPKEARFLRTRPSE